MTSMRNPTGVCYICLITVEPLAYIFLVANERAANESIWRISEVRRGILTQKLSSFSGILGDFRLPSRHALTRYLESFTNTFLKHYPMLHLPTSSVESMPIELSLAAAAIGARYRFEPLVAVALYQAAKAITLTRLEEVKSFALSTVGINPYLPISSDPDHFGIQFDGAIPTGHNDLHRPHLTHLICTTTLLIAFTMSHDEPDLFNDSLEFQVPLVRMLHLDGLCESPQEGQNQDWKSWLQGECRRRAKLIAFAYLNLQFISQNVPPVILVNEVDMNLPCPTAEWEAASSDGWHRVRSPQAEISFKDAHEALFAETNGGHEADFCWQISSLGRLILLHSVIQKIFLAKQLQSHSRRNLSSEDQQKFESVISSLQARESS